MRHKKRYVGVVSILAIAMTLAAACYGCAKTPTLEGGAKSSAASYESVEKQWFLSEGYYMAGTDVPAGTFDVTPTSGIGFIASKKLSANLRGPGHDDQDGYAQSYKNYKLTEGDILAVKGVQIRIDYSSVQSLANGRRYDESAATELSAGSYVVGNDLKPGRYNVRYVEGHGGFVATNRTKGECILSGNMDGDPDTDQYVDLVSNVVLEEGEEVNVTSGLTVRFVPEQQQQSPGDAHPTATLHDKMP